VRISFAAIFADIPSWHSVFCFHLWNGRFDRSK